MPRPRKVVSLQKGRIAKAIKSAREDGEKRIKVDANDLRPPAWLCDEAALEFERIVNEAAKIGSLDNLDLSVLAVYADNYARYEKAATYINIHGPTFETSTGRTATSAWLNVLDRAAKNIFTCSNRLGLAATDRLKLITPVKEEKSVNKFVQFLDNGAAAGDST